MNPSATTIAGATPRQDTGQDIDADKALYAKVSWRLLPLLLICYMVAYLDRINIGYAQIQMKQTLDFGDAAYGFGAGLFFIGYFLFEVPSNLLLEKIGTRKTLMRIMLVWGVIATAMAWVSTPLQFYVARFLLGAFEAGFFPGVILYFTYWYPSARRGRVISIFLSAVMAMAIAAGPLCGAILKYMDGIDGLHGWQWLFLIQGPPACILGLILYVYLQDRPADAKWLTDAEKARLQHNLANESGQATHHGSNGHKDAHGSATLGQLLRDPRVYALSLVYFMMHGATYLFVFWMPTVIQGLGVQDVLHVGIYSAIPFVAGFFGMIAFGASSDRFRDRRWHLFIATGMAISGLIVTLQMHGHLEGSLIALAFTLIGLAALPPLFFALVSDYLSPAVAAGGIALISSLGNLGSAASPTLAGLLTQYTGNRHYSIYLVLGMLILSALVLMVAVRPAKARQGQAMR
ncbi:putative metabolite transport protein NicT [Comamonas sp. PE63]|uniref:Metabolite transport protein NicT n=1 Tax=Comamonas brasiliensis TaxID=1812482 RepID=A0ABS5LPB4_9BURK|nr:MFS transporter [Comamonas sp. PE63]MBS3018335.1 putative metabolite transport protein NicT [Comamonas sp. PE63]